MPPPQQNILRFLKKLCDNAERIVRAEATVDFNRLFNTFIVSQKFKALDSRTQMASPQAISTLTATFLARALCKHYQYQKQNASLFIRALAMRPKRHKTTWNDIQDLTDNKERKYMIVPPIDGAIVMHE